MESRRGSPDRAGYVGNRQEFWPSATKDAGQNSSPTGTQRYQPSRKGIGSKEDRPRDGKTTSMHAHNHQESSEARKTSRTTRLGSRTTQDGSSWDSAESDFVSRRLKQPIRPTTSFTTTTTTKPTTLGQTTRTPEAHHHDEGGGADDEYENDDDDTPLILSQINER